MSVAYFPVEYVLGLLLCQPLACISHGNLYIVLLSCGIYANLSTFRSKLTGIVGKSVYHEQGQHSVSLHHRFSLPHLQFNSPCIKGCAVFAYNIEQIVESETSHLDTQSSLVKFYPLCEQSIVVVDLFCQLFDILSAEMSHFLFLCSRL